MEMEAEIYLYIFIILIAFFAGFMGSVAGGGGLISIPMLIFIGLDPQVAIGTNKVLAIGASSSAFYNYNKKNLVNWKLAVPFGTIAFIGGIIGAQLMVVTPSKYMRPIVALILILVLMNMVKDFGLIKKTTSKNKQKLGYIVFFLCTIFAGFFGGGSGLLILTSLVYFFGLPIITANATDSVPWVILSFSSLAIFALNGLVHWGYGLSMIIGSLVGGYVGANTAVKKGNKWVKNFFSVVILIFVFKLLT